VTAAIIFGITKALAGTIQSGYTPPINGYLMDAVPYLLMIAVVAGLVGRVRPPASDGIPYAPESA
jgi:simple sugar transport system permease protein